MRGKDDIIEKEPSRDRWEKIDVIPLFTFLGVNNLQPILHMSERLVYIYTTEKQINKFAIGYMINPSLHVNELFIDKIENTEESHFIQISWKV